MNDTLKSQVEQVLIDIPETRNNDIDLTIGVWSKFYGVNGTLQTQSLHSLPTQESIKRMRAIFNQSGKYLPTDEKVLIRRAQHSETVRNYIRQTKLTL